MRILYAAIDQQIPGTKGGSTHVRAVAEGLAARGHEVHGAVSLGNGSVPATPGVTWHGVSPPWGRAQLRLLRRGTLRDLARSVRPHVVIERYHNFGGEGLLGSHAFARSQPGYQRPSLCSRPRHRSLVIASNRLCLRGLVG